MKAAAAAQMQFAEYFSFQKIPPHLPIRIFVLILPNLPLYIEIYTVKRGSQNSEMLRYFDRFNSEYY
jgi:hypothetical protein